MSAPPRRPGRLAGVVLLAAFAGIGALDPLIGPARTRLARADLGTVRARQVSGQLEVAVTTAPEPLVVGPAEIHVLVLDRATGAALGPAGVAVELAPPGEASPIQAPPAGLEAGGLLGLRFPVALSAPGPWTLRVRVREGADLVDLEASLAVAAPPSGLAGLGWPLAWPPLAIAVYAAHQALRHRRWNARARRPGAATAACAAPRPGRYRGA